MKRIHFESKSVSMNPPRQFLCVTTVTSLELDDDMRTIDTVYSTGNRKWYLLDEDLKDHLRKKHIQFVS